MPTVRKIQDRGVERNVKARSRYHSYRGKEISITYSECAFVALVIQYAKCIGHIAICGLPRSTILPYFFTLSHKRHDFLKKKKVIEHKMYVLIFSTPLSETFLIPRRTERDILKNVYWFSYK